MSTSAPERTVALPPAPAAAPARDPRLVAIARETPVLWALALLGAFVLLGLGWAVTPDSWLALVGGREVARGGPPSVDTLTTWTQGRRWIDQQWLAQWVLHGAWRLGGLRALGLLHAVTVLGAYAVVLVGARRRGAAPGPTAAVGALAAIPYLLVAGNIRPQGFALLLWAVVLWLTAAHDRRRTPRVLWVLPLLLLWANLHGSVVLGVGLVALTGGLELLGVARGRDGSGPRGAALVLVAPLTLLATPYGTGVFGYLRDLLGNAEIARVASDWQPTGLSVPEAPFFLLGLAGAVLVLRDRRGLTAFELLVLGGTFAGALAAGRNLGFFALTAVLLLPGLLTRARAGRTRRRWVPARFVEPLGVMAIAGILVAAAVGLARMPAQVHHRYPDAVAVQLARTARTPGTRVWAHPQYADWLMLTQPSLDGRLPFDIRFELLTEAELRRFVTVTDHLGPRWRDALGGARLVLFDRSDRPGGDRPPASTVLLREPGTRQLARAGDAVLLRRP